MGTETLVFGAAKPTGKRRGWIGVAVAAVLGSTTAGAAVADPAPAPGGSPEIETSPNGTVYFDYANVGIGGGPSINDVGGGGAAVLPIGASFAAQGQASYHYLTASGGAGSGSIDNWDVGGNAYWHGSFGRLGAGVDYIGIGAHGGATTDAGTVSLVSYGAFVDWYPASRLTLAAKGGGITGSGPGFSSTLPYVGGQAIGYLRPNLALSGTIDWAGNSSGSFTVAGVQAEWLISEKTPLSVFGAYDYVGGAGTRLNVLRVGVKYYIGGAGSLVRRQRGGVDDWSGLDTVLRYLIG